MMVKFCLPLSGKAAAAVLGAAALMSAGGALAEATQQPASGLMNFRNARMEAATPAQRATGARTTTVGEAGARAFKDPVTGDLREPEADEIVVDRAKRSDLRPPLTVYRTTKGGISIPLDESFLVNSVASRNADGKLEMQCVKGEDAAAHAKHSEAGKARHDR